MYVEKFRKNISKLRRLKTSFLNDTFLWVKIAIDAILELPDTKFEFDVPKAGNVDKIITVSRYCPIELKKRIVEKDIYNSAIVTVVSAIEDYFLKLAALIIDYNAERIKYATPEDGIINTAVMNEDKHNINSPKVGELVYVGPKGQREYFGKVLGLNIEDSCWEQWVEIKARRDVIVHNGGIINDIYIKKTKNLHRFKVGDEATVNNIYFSESISGLKRMIGVLDRETKKQYNLSSRKQSRIFTRLP